ncbi:MAG: CvpA family protein [Sphingopyxis sp.]|nr:CvpA family protein [Sphingopyxis sp.]
MTSLDMAVLLMVGGGAILGFLRGLVQEVTSLIAWVAAIAAVYFLHSPTTQLLSGQVGTPGAAALLAYTLLFGVVFLLGKWGSRAMGHRARASIVGGIDRGLGAGFGAVKGLLVATLLFMLATLIYDLGFGGDAPRPAWMSDSRTYPALSATASALSGVIAERRAERKTGAP